MKNVAFSAGSELAEVVNSAQTEQVILTIGGKPKAVLIGIENYDAEDFRLASSNDFWEMIEDRRRSKGIPLAELKARLQAQSKSRSKTESSRPGQRAKARQSKPRS